MIYWIPAFVLLLLLFLAVFLPPGRQLHDARTVLLHVPCDQAWEKIRDFPALHAAHTRGRPDLVIRETEHREGHGLEPGSVWRQKGSWRGESYWADLQLIHWDPPHRLTVRLVRDSLSTERGLVRHRGELTLVPDGPAVTKLTWRLSARLGATPLMLARLLWPERMRTRLLDLGLRSVKRAIDGHARGQDSLARGSLEPEAQALVPEFRSPDPPRRGPAIGSTNRMQDQG